MLLEGRKYIPFIEEYVPEIADEIKGIAKGAGRGYDEIVTLISYYELGEGIPNLCTCFGVTGEATVNGETYIGQNWDSEKPILGVMLYVKRDSGPNVLTYADYGFPASYGL
ncbi:MAG: hypothetical protein GWN64_15955, partial [Candidatus Thorarchaeota archaeon]|nr:hypothetical protein [Candidatus Thorarchaeota archaeon]